MVKNVLTKIISTRKDFSYEQNGVSLKFNLPVDNSSQLKAFRLCLGEAIKDIDTILNEMKN